MAIDKTMKTIETRIKYYVDYDGNENFVPQVLIPEPYEKPRNLIDFLLWLFYALGKSVHDLFVKPVWKSLYVRVPRKYIRVNGVGVSERDYKNITDEIEVGSYEMMCKSEDEARFIIEKFIEQESERMHREKFKPKNMYI